MTRIFTIFSLALIISACVPQRPFDCPAEPGQRLIAGVSFDWDSHVRMAPGSDNWPVTWSDDDHQYTSWGDGGGFGGTNSDGRASLGFARIEGERADYNATNLWGGQNAANSPAFNGKSYGMTSIGGILYAWWGPGSGTVTPENPAQAGSSDGDSEWDGRTIYRQTQLLVSYDKGQTWARSGWDLATLDDQLIIPTILNFGKDNDGARDEYVYHYFVRKEPTGPGLTIHRGGSPATGKIDLARVPADEMMNVASYQFYAGLDDCGQPIWEKNHASRIPVFEDENGVGWTVSVSYNAPLKRYILMTEHGETASGRLGIFEATEPWGPWHRIAYFDDPPFGQDEVQTNTFYWNFSNKWLSEDGMDFVIIFTGIGENDSWNTVHGRFHMQYPAGEQ